MTIRSIILLSLLVGMAGLCSAGVIVNNVNPGTAYTSDLLGSSTPALGPTFTLTSFTLITEVFTYHQNGLDVAPPDVIGIEDTDTTTIYQWTASEIDPNSGLPTGDRGWWAYPNVVVPAGDYIVLDSDPLTWSFNGGSGWLVGMSEVDGTTVPEPASLLLLAPGLLFLLRKRRAA